MKCVRPITIFLCAAVTAGVALASWYDDYDAGLKALHDGQFQTVVQKMTSAISGNSKESNNARTYGAIFINYHPYYYRAVAYMNLGKYKEAEADLERTSGPGAVDRGSVDALMREVKAKLAEVSTQPPVTETVRPIPTQTVAPPPVSPSMDNALRSRAERAVGEARSHLQSAQQRKATTSNEYGKALDQFTQMNTRFANAKSNDDLNAVIAMTDNVIMYADSAQPPAVVITTTQPPVTSTARTTSATQIVLGDTTRRLRRAFQNYFNGDFDEATRDFQSLATDMPKNAWIWAFLGASQYSQYAFEADETYRASAISSFRKAKTYGKWKDGLPEKYFSKKIRKAFKENAG
ncbi:MAG TPA: tetratricopeptide repeat protein [Thermoanaerobaculia bacterium]|jgi:tetratricopeptide (TPR) repeat protein